MATLYKTTGYVRKIKPKDGNVFTYEELKALVGGMVEIVPLSDGRSIVVNEEGKLIGLPYNAKASAQWNKYYPINQYPYNNDQTIVGDAVIADDAELQ